MHNSLHNTMDSQQWYWFVGLVCCFLLYYRRLESKKTAEEEPTEWPLLGHLFAMLANVSHFHDWATGVLAATRYNFTGHMGLTGVRFFLTCDPSNVRHIFISNSINYPRGEEYADIYDVMGDGIFNADGESWRRQRAKSQIIMASPRFRSFSARYSCDKVEKSLLPFLAHAADAGARCDLHDVLLRLTFDMTCNLVFGVDPGCLQIGLPNVPFTRAMDDVLETLFLRHVIPPACWRLMYRYEFGPEKKMAVARRIIDRFAADTIAKRRSDHKLRGEGVTESSDILSFFICNDDASEYSDDFLRDTIVNLLFAGRDTTGAVLSWFFYLLCKNPRVEQMILDELVPIAATKKLEGMVVFDASELSSMVYLHAALCECLRLYPSVPITHKAAADNDVLPSGHEIKAGDKILVYSYSMGRMEGVWGKDCMEFSPERWVTDDGKLRYQQPYKFIAFNAGPRTCLGKEVAFTQMKAVAATVLWNFILETVPGHVVQPKLSIILHMKNGLAVTVKRRNFTAMHG